MIIVADNTVPYLKGVAETFAEVRYISSSEFIHENVQDADVLIVRSIDKCTRELLQNTSIKLITTATIGFDHIDIHYCDEAGIKWTNAPGCNAVSVAQYVLSSLIITARKTGESLQGKTLGIVGVGHVGTQLECLARKYGMNVLRNDPPRAIAEKNDTFVDLDTIAKQSDIISIHTPFTKEGEYPTYHLANRTFFQKLEKKPWFINASRGAVHDTEALLEAKKNGLISEMIIDCWEREPNINQELLKLTTLATPHIAGFSADGKANGTRMCLEAISRFFNQKIENIGLVTPLPPVNPVIDLNFFTGNRIEEAILTSFNPLKTDALLRQSPEKFEWFRSHYDHPREYKAYTVVNATQEEASLLKKLGFQVQ
ncbi:4-phosphoerythronate dehydrogenase PdxB [Parabacteroides pacaensis]|uniref:4-phosphoerythronate dehydrogenase PdxB n=1 Tax=Parabacteroides pacaensis TaxID=2086575 RepID=UPI000D0E771C|nr:4-phosphoerythronate dehydrogenase PdxB [Parabacteroides pacaensis]